MKLKKPALNELNLDPHHKKKKPITDHFDFGLCYFILVTGKFFEKNFFIDIYINFKSILEKFFKKNKLQYTLFRGLGNN